MIIPYVSDEMLQWKTHFNKVIIDYFLAIIRVFMKGSLSSHTSLRNLGNKNLTAIFLIRQKSSLTYFGE